MKRKKMNQKLELNKVSVTNLNHQIMIDVKGGLRAYSDYPCHTVDWGTECTAGYGCSDPVCEGPILEGVN